MKNRRSKGIPAPVWRTKKNRHTIRDVHNRIVCFSELIADIFSCGKQQALMFERMIPDDMPGLITVLNG